MTWPVEAIGWALFLPLALAAVGVLATAAGDGPEVARLLGGWFVGSRYGPGVEGHALAKPSRWWQL